MRAVVATFVLALFASLPWGTLAQDSEPIWSGVYTAAQAERGRTVVQSHCGECHSDDLAGGEGPALAGTTFMTKWETHSVERLFQKIRDTMPSIGSTEVSEKEKLDAVAFILQQNGFPAGSTELTEASPSFAAIRLVPKGGSAGPRSGALVQAIGCLQRKRREPVGAHKQYRSPGDDARSHLIAKTSRHWLPPVRALRRSS